MTRAPDPELWRSRPGSVGDRERERASTAIGDPYQLHLRAYGGGIP